jgi:5-methylcytosine-specific restriction protein A
LALRAFLVALVSSLNCAGLTLMATRPARFCPNGVRAQGKAAKVEADQRRGSARARGYSAAWDKAAKGHRKASPFCRYCELGVWGDPPVIVSATQTDHLYPHRTFAGVFWLSELWVSCCDTCHSGPKQALERRGRQAIDQLARRLGLPTLDQVLAAAGPPTSTSSS